MKKAGKDEFIGKLQSKLNENVDFLESLSNKKGNLKFNLKESEVVVAACLESIMELTNEYGALGVKGFGDFKTVHREQRKGRNPQNGEEVLIPAKRVAKFKPGKTFSQVVSE